MSLKLDESSMRHALDLARKGCGHVHPNPMVGAVLVRDGRIVGKGFHRVYGKAHAEIEAVRQAGSKARGATLYINLEPCAHWGKTPPCVEALVRAGIRRVVAAMRDPNPLVQGKGFAFLRRHGIAVTNGVLEPEAHDLNRSFVTWIREHRPYVTLKAAVSLDGKIATAQGESQWITGPLARAAGHRFRAEVDAIAVGIETVLKDNPSLTAHGKGPHPKRIIFDSALRVPLNARTTDRSAPTWVFTTDKAPVRKRQQLENRGVSTYTVAAGPQGRVSLREAAAVLAREGVTHLLVEGGGTLLASFLEAGLADEVLWFIAPILIGGTKSAVEGAGIKRLADAWRLDDIHIERMGEDICMKGKIQR